MQIITALLSLAVLMSVNPASAQKTYLLSVSRHPSVVNIKEQQVDDILAAASRMLQKSPGFVNGPDDVACNVTFKRTGPVHTFASPNTPAVITTKSDRDAVHAENFDNSVVNVKIVQKIGFCRPQRGTNFAGCSWPESFRSIIVVADQPAPELVWPHEFGHQTGLWHRKGLGTALMSPCSLTATNVQVTPSECSCFRSGPGTCLAPEPKPFVTCGPP